MPDAETYKHIEVTGTSPESISAAMRSGVEKAAQTVRHLDWLEITRMSAQVKDGSIEHFQVSMKIGFRLE